MQSSSKQYQLEKSLWTDKDFDQMSWHDCKIHGMSFSKDFELLFDIDYVFKWVEVGKRFNFWIAPCTLVFENVYNISLENRDTNFEISEVSRIDPVRPKNADFIKREIEHTWIIELVTGEISFQSVGFKQYVRSFPIYNKQQHLSPGQRGEVSFEKVTLQL